MSVLTGLGLLAVVPRAAEAHVCDPNTGECEETPVVPNWRDNYVPLFDLEDRDDEAQRRDAQRWRDECDNQSQCIWLDSTTSLFNDAGDPDPSASPNEVHGGIGASHCFAFEGFHQCENHDPAAGEGVHDAHGGAIYVDVCLAQNNDPETNKWCDEGLKDTQAGVTIMDHNPCGLVVPIVACTDEYHVVRPFDTDYTTAQMDNTQAALALIIADPARYICGYHDGGTQQTCYSNVSFILALVGW